MCFNGHRFWLELGLAGVIRFEKAYTHAPYGGNYNNLRCIVVHFGGACKISRRFQLCRFCSVLHLASEENTVWRNNGFVSFGQNEMFQMLGSHAKMLCHFQKRITWGWKQMGVSNGNSMILPLGNNFFMTLNQQLNGLNWTRSINGKEHIWVWFS